MRYHVPILQLAQELPPQTTLQDKFGGLPWGLPAARWPVCQACARPQSLLAQWMHDAARLDLGRAGRVLHIFQCAQHPGMCATWQGGSGTNSGLVTEPEELQAGISAWPDATPVIERELFVAAWHAHDDGLDANCAAAFYAEKELLKLPAAERAKITAGTRLGGVPFWLQSADEAPAPGWRFAGQLGSTHDFHQAPQVPHADLMEDRKRLAGRTHYCAGPRFGDGGIGYVFLRDSAERDAGRSRPPEAWFFWQSG